MTIGNYSKEDRKILQDEFGKGGYKIKVEHCGDTLYVKENGRFQFYTMNPRMLLNALKEI